MQSIRSVGPINYTISVVRVLMEMSDDPIERVQYSNMLEALNSGNLRKFREFPGNPGLIVSKEIALAAVAEHLDSKINWLDMKTKVEGRAVYARYVRDKLRKVADEVGFSGNIDSVVEHLVEEAAMCYDW